MAAKSDAARIKRALETGQLFVTEQTGFKRFIYARCPKDRNDSPVYRQEKSGQALSRLIFRCPICGTEFERPVNSMFLR